MSYVMLPPRYSHCRESASVGLARFRFLQTWQVRRLACCLKNVLQILLRHAAPACNECGGRKSRIVQVQVMLADNAAPGRWL